MKDLETRFKALTEERQQELFEQFGGDCFEDIKDELENWMLYMGAVSHGVQG